jgi:hypothetical protein
MSSIFRSKLFAILLISALILPGLLAVPVMAVEEDYPYTTGDDEVADALNYLRSVQESDGKISDFSTSAWAVMAIAAAGEDPDDWKDDPANPSIVDYLAANAASANKASDYARMLLAIAAADQDPTDFGGVDFVALLEAEHVSNQIGNALYLNDDFWGVMGLIAAGQDPATSTIIQDGVAFILDNQNDIADGGDGGWGSAPEAASDVDDTAAAIMALIAAGESPSLPAIADGLAYIKSTQMEGGGFPFFGETNSASDSWGIDGIVAAGENPTDEDWESEQNKNPVDDLLSLQNPDGSFDLSQTTEANQKLWTSYAIPALLGVPYPVAVLEPQEPEPGVTVDVRIEGQSQTIWSGTVTVNDSTIIDDQDGEHYLSQPTALGALDEAASEGEFPYAVQDTAYGLYLYSIDGEEAEGMSGWMYRVDYISPLDSVDQFILNDAHQEVLFYYGDWMEPPIPLKIEVDNIAPDAGDSFTVIVSEYDDAMANWDLIEDATVYADTEYTTDENGEVEITIYNNTTIDIYAEMEGHIRSNSVTVTVGEGSSQQAEGCNVNMTVDIIPAISFSVDPDYINFGVLGPRDISQPVTITITNEGAWRLAITAMVSDNADNLYVDGLKLDNIRWDNFEGTVRRAKSETCQVTLTVPETYTGTGNQNGTIIFWATESPY